MTMTPRRSAVKSEPKSDTESSTGKSDEILLADNFPSKTFLVIEFCDADDPDVACWSEDGTYFLVKNTAAFAASHLPRYFKHSNFQSFVRQLNIYGWRTVKQPNSSGGSVAFHHKFFQRGRRDLLGNIKRSKKTTRKSNMQEEKKDDDYSTFNSRFDEMQEQMDSLSEKLDLLISLVSAGADPVVSRRNHAGSKRRRRTSKDHRGSPVSDVTDPTEASDEDVQGYATRAAVAAPPVAPPPPFSLDMSIADEVGEALANVKGPRFQKDYNDLLALRESTMELDEQQYAGCYEAGQDECAMEDDGFKLFIGKVLDGDQQGLDGNSEHGTQETMEEDTDSSSSHDGYGSNTLVADPLMSKVHPETVEGSVDIPQMTATAVEHVHSNQEYDEEAGDYATSTPFTTAVAVSDDDSAAATQKRYRRRTKFFFATVILLILAAFIVWPLVTFAGKKNKKTTKKNHYERHHSRSGSSSSSWSNSEDYEGNAAKRASGDFDGQEWTPPPRYSYGQSWSGSGRGSGGAPDPGDGSNPSIQQAVTAHGTWDNAFDYSDESEDQSSESGGILQRRSPPPLSAKAGHDAPLTLGLNGDSYQCVIVQQQSP